MSSIVVSDEPIGVVIAAIPLDEGTQMRVQTDEATVKRYAEAMQAGDVFPPIILFRDEGGGFHVGDGFHRLKAAIDAGRDRIDAEVRAGTRRDALIFSLSANSKNALPRSNDDIRKAVVWVLRDPELRQLTQREQAAICGCQQATVSKIKNELYPGTKQNKGRGAVAAGDAAADSRSASDNGYQAASSFGLDTPEQVVAALADDERATVLALLSRRDNKMYNEPKQAKLLERLGLATVYGEQWQKTVEWTPLADGVLAALLGGDDWARFEVELANLGDSQRFLTYGTVRPLLEKLAQAAGWVASGDIGYALVGFMDVLVQHGEVAKQVVELGQYDKRRFYHITAAGCQRLGLEPPYAILHAAPTKEELEADDQVRKAAAKAGREREEAERLVKLDPAQEAEREREQMLSAYYGVGQVRKTLNGCKWLDVAEINVALDALDAAVRAAGVRPDKRKQPATATAPVDRSELDRLMAACMERVGATVAPSPTPQAAIMEIEALGAPEPAHAPAFQVGDKVRNPYLGDQVSIITSIIDEFAYLDGKKIDGHHFSFLKRIENEPANPLPTARPLDPARAWELELAEGERKALAAALAPWRGVERGAGWFGEGDLPGVGALTVQHLASRGLLEKMQLDDTHGNPVTSYRIAQDGVDALQGQTGDEREPGWPEHWLPFTFDIGQKVGTRQGLEFVVAARHHNGRGARYYRSEALPHTFYGQDELEAVDGIGEGCLVNEAVDEQTFQFAVGQKVKMRTHSGSAFIVRRQRGRTHPEREYYWLEGHANSYRVHDLVALDAQTEAGVQP